MMILLCSTSPQCIEQNQHARIILWSLSGAIRYFDCKVPDQGNTRIDEDDASSTLGLFAKKLCRWDTYRFYFCDREQDPNLISMQKNFRQQTHLWFTCSCRIKGFASAALFIASTVEVCKENIRLLYAITPLIFGPFPWFFLHSNYMTVHHWRSVANWFKST